MALAGAGSCGQVARYDRARIAGVAGLRGIGPVGRAHLGGKADIAAGSRP